MANRVSLHARATTVGVLMCGTLLVLSHPALTAPRGKAAASRPAAKAKSVGRAAASPGTKPASKPAATAINAPAVPPPGNQLMPISEVKAGMRGYGLTVFQGTKIERFNVEVLGVLPKSYMNRPLVLVRLSGGPISERGAYLIQGMSGSPIYINGKLLGAFSMGNTWPKEPIGMVTPIEEMMEALDPKLSEVPTQTIAANPFAGALQPAAEGYNLLPSPEQAAKVRVAGQTFQPLGIPIAVSGLTGARLDRVAEVLQPFHMNVMSGPGSMDKPFKAELVPGAAVGVALMTGDIEMTGIGTVTYRKGDQILAFGHPMMQIGAAQFPITTAWIHDVFPGFNVSSKIGSAGELIGTLTQDRPFSIAGRIGKLPEMIPVECRIDDKATGRTKTFNVKAANHPLLIGQLLPIAVSQSLSSMRPVPGDTVAQVKLQIETEGAGTIVRENRVYDGFQIDMAATRELTELMSLLSNNAFQRIPVKSLNVQVTLENSRPTATIERIFIDQDKLEPGQEASLGVVLRPYRKEPIILRTKVHVPESANNGRAVLMVQGGATRVNITSLLSGGTGSPAMLSQPESSIDELIRRVSERERNDQIVVRLIFPTSAVSINGEKLSQLPPSIVNVMRSSKTTGLRLEREEAKAFQDTDYIVQGVQTLSLTVAKKDHSESSSSSSSTTRSPSTTTTSPATSGGTTRLSVVEDEGELQALPNEDLLQFTVDGKNVTIPLTPELEERQLEEQDRKKGESGEKDGKNDRSSRDSKSGKNAQSAKDAKSTKTAPAASKTTPASGAASGSGATKSADESSDESSDEKLLGRPARFWTQTAQADFERGTLTNTAVSSNGEVRLTPSLKLLSETDELFVWSVLGMDGGVYAGTGNTGLVLKFTEGGKPEVAFRTNELTVHALARDSDGNLYAGTSPNGKVFKITPNGQGTEILSLNGKQSVSKAGGKFVLSLTVGRDGTVYAGTGPEGKIYRIRPGQPAEEWCRLPSAKSVMCLRIGPDEALYAGTAEEGLVYRLNTGGEPNPVVLYHTGQPVVNGLAFDPNGNLFAACAPSGRIYQITTGAAPRLHFTDPKNGLYGLLSDVSGNLYTCSGDSILRIEKDGTATVLTDPKNGQFTSLTWDENGRLLAGSANLGSVYRLAPSQSGTFESTVHDAKASARWGRVRLGGELTPGATLLVETRSGNTPEPDSTWSEWAKLQVKDNGSYVSSPPARYLQYRVKMTAQSGSPALRDISIAYLPQNQAPKLTLASPKGGEIWRGSQTLRWSAADPDSDTLTYEIAYSADGGKTWKPVGEQTAKSAAPASGSEPRPSRPTREDAEQALAQYKAQLDQDTTLSAEQRSESYERAKALVDKYLEENPAGTTGRQNSGTSTATTAASPAKPAGVTREAKLTWDTKQVPDGVYLIRVIATDKASNPNEPLSDEHITEPIIIANTEPKIFVFERGIQVDARKSASVTGWVAAKVAIRGAQYRVGNGDWTAIEPEDGIWDSPYEYFRFNVTDLQPGSHNLEVKVVDVAGNAGSSTATVKAP